MGREIRRVPADWEHPRYTAEDAPRSDLIGRLRPLFDEDHETAAEQWMADLALWQQGKHSSQPCEFCRYYWEYAPPPDVATHRARKWTAEEATHWQVYETVSEGTPVTPHFATPEELIEYLVANGDFWDQKRGDGGWSRESATKFVKGGWAPSAIIADGKMYAPRDGMPS